MIEIFSDFDGTLSSRDTLDLLLERFAPPHWRDLDEAMLSGRIPEREGLRAEMVLLREPDEVLLAALDEAISPAEGLSELIGLLQRRGWPLTVVSGGLVKFSAYLWNKWDYGHIPLLANDHRRNGRGGIEVIEAPTPRLKENCSHCKSYHVREAVERGSTVVYIGDGLTDFCPAQWAQRRYAKGHLLEHLRKNGMEVIPFNSLKEVAEDLSYALRSSPRHK